MIDYEPHKPHIAEDDLGLAIVLYLQRQLNLFTLAFDSEHLKSINIHLTDKLMISSIKLNPFNRHDLIIWKLTMILSYHQLKIADYEFEIDLNCNSTYSTMIKSAFYHKLNASNILLINHWIESQLPYTASISQNDAWRHSLTKKR